MLLLCLPLSALADPEPAPAASGFEMFVRAGCPHCEEAERFVARLRLERPGLQVIIHDVRQDPDALERLLELTEKSGALNAGVPTFLIREELIIGFSGEESTGAHIQALLDLPPPQVPAGAAAGACAVDTASGCAAPEKLGNETLELPWLGTRISLDEVGLPLFTMVMGLLDGFNPCSMWVLLMMVSMLAGSRDRKKMLAIAGTFVAIEGVAYFAFMAAWLNLFLLIGISRSSELILGAITFIFGLINIKDFWAYGRGLSLSIPAARKPGIYARMWRILHEQSLWLAVAGTAVLAVLVQIVELLCTSGFPAIYTRILTLRQLDPWTYYAYLLLYNAMYMLDDVVVLAIGVVTLSQQRLQEKEGRRLKLLSGMVMLALGVYLLAVPH